MIQSDAVLSPAYFRFFRELASNNSKAWFDENRSRYERDVKRPFYAMITAWIEAVQPFDPELQASASDVIYRINRDIRFSADKTPYKVQMGAHLNLRGKKAMGFPGVYMEVGASGGGIAAGRKAARGARRRAGHRQSSSSTVRSSGVSSPRTRPR